MTKLKLWRNEYMCFFFFLLCCSTKNVKNELALQPQTPCDCKQVFIQLVEKLEANYIGLALLRDTKAYSEYEVRKSEFINKSEGRPDHLCTALLSDFLAPFDDGHLFVRDIPKYDSSFLDLQKSILHQEKKTRAEIDLMLTDKSDLIVGKWSDGESVFAIVYADSTYNGYLIKSKRTDVQLGDLKVRLGKRPSTYIGTYISYDGSEKYARATIYKNGERLNLSMGGSITWRRSENEQICSFDKTPSIKKINDIHTLISIPSFSIDGKEFKKTLKENSKLLEDSQHLIIDIRGNTGGNSIYFPLIKYFANKNLILQQGYVLSSPDNRAYFKNFIGFWYSKTYSPLIERMSRTGKIVNGPKYPDKKFSKANNKIARVSILTDNGCKSASESFILHAKGASDKVMTFGSPTGGVIDYTSVNIVSLKNSGRQNIYFGYPTGTLHQDILENGYNTTGIVPDVHITQTGEILLQIVMDKFEEDYL